MYDTEGGVAFVLYKLPSMVVCGFHHGAVVLPQTTGVRQHPSVSLVRKREKSLFKKINKNKKTPSKSDGERTTFPRSVVAPMCQVCDSAVFLYSAFRALFIQALFIETGWNEGRAGQTGSPGFLRHLAYSPNTQLHIQPCPGHHSVSQFQKCFITAALSTKNPDIIFNRNSLLSTHYTEFL